MRRLSASTKVYLVKASERPAFDWWLRGPDTPHLALGLFWPFTLACQAVWRVGYFVYREPVTVIATLAVATVVHALSGRWFK